jgi:hypothetical protein
MSATSGVTTSNSESISTFRRARGESTFSFSRDGDEILFEHLERDNARSAAPVLRDQIDRVALFPRRTFVVRVYENIGVEKATSVHGFRRDGSANRANRRLPKDAGILQYSVPDRLIRPTFEGIRGSPG